MKVIIGPYKSWIGPYQIAEKLCWWAKPVTDERGFKSKPQWVFNFGTWLSGGEHDTSVLVKICQWAESKRKRKVMVKIHPSDTWSMDSTLALIVVPMLEQLKTTKHGAPFVDDSDVPDSIKSITAAPKVDEWDTDSNHFLRWDWVLDEMIFAFACKNTDWESQYYTGVSDWKSNPSEWDANNKPTLYQMVTGPDHTLQCDDAGRQAHQARITNGFRLFGKYYEALWD